MKNIFKTLYLCILFLAFIFTAGCSAENADNNKNILGQIKEDPTYIPQEVQPIEENPSMMTKELRSESELHRLSVQRPQMDEINSSGDLINAILGSANQVEKLQNYDLLNSAYLDTGDQQVNKTLSDQSGYLEMVVQKADNQQDDGDHDGLWGRIGVNIPTSHAFSAADTNSAILFKYRYTAPLAGFQTSFGNGSAAIHTGVSTDFHLFLDAGHNFMGYSADSRGEYANALVFIENEWYFTLAALDKDYGYRYITWQENNPSNHAFYACDLSAIFNPYIFFREQGMWAGLNFFAGTNEVSVDIESLTVYEFENFNDVESVNLHDDTEVYSYSDDHAKFQLAFQLFEDGDYYNAYTLFKELDGYDTSDYLAECERLLKTIEIKNPYVAGMIKKALKEQGRPMHEFLFVYQAENFESLDLSECRIEDLSFISEFTNLKELNLDKNAVSDLTPLKDLYSLERLSLGKNNISDITPLNDLANLQYLNLNDNLLEDVSPLKTLTSLKEIDLSTNNIITIADMHNLENLESVNLSYNLISSISVLGNSPLKDLNIMNTDINDLGAVANFTKLETLKAGFIYIWKGNEGYLLTRKYELDNHFFDGLSGLEALAGHNNLKRLYLGRLNGGSLEPLTKLTNLETLIFHQYSGADDPGVLANLVNLKELALDSAGIGFYDTSFLSSLTQLEKLYIGTFCYVEDLSVISGLTNLKELRMYKYGENLSFLTELKELRLLELRNWDTVDDYTPLLMLENLEYLALEEMKVDDLSIISQIKSLKFLRLDSAQINNITDVGRLENLECFLLRNPQIAGEIAPDLFGRSLFAGLDHLKFAAMRAGAEKGFAYDLGDPRFVEIIEEPPYKGIEEPDYDFFWVDNVNAMNYLSDYVGSHHLVIDGLFLKIGESIKLTLPKYARNLYIFSYDDQPVKIELDGGDNKGLERLVIGHVDVSSDDPDGFGNGNFIIKNLDGLSDCTNLKEVYINSSKIDDISALANLDKLDILELPGNQISDVSALAIYKD